MNHTVNKFKNKMESLCNYTISYLNKITDPISMVSNIIIFRMSIEYNYNRPSKPSG